MFYLGLDVHSKWMTISGFDPATGEAVVFDRVSNDEASFRQILASLDGPLHGAMETGTNAWAMYRKLQPYFAQLLIVDPATVWGREVRRGPKTDKRDAMGLARKLARGELHGLYVPDARTQAYRDLVRAKIHATQLVTQLSNQLGSLLRSWGLLLPGSVLSKQGQTFIADSREHIPELSRMVLDQWLHLLKETQATVARLEAQIAEIAQEDENCQRLMTIPQVGPFTALVIRAEVGDIHRFREAKQLVAYCGLCPSVYASGGKVSYGRLSKACNRVLRYALLLRASGMTKLPHDNPLKQAYWRVAVHDHVNSGKLNLARKLIRIIYAMLTHKEDWNPTPMMACTA